MRKAWPTLALAVVFFMGLSLLLYPVVSDAWVSWRQAKVVEAYENMIAETTGPSSEENPEAPPPENEEIKRAREYNARLLSNSFLDPDEIDKRSHKEYMTYLNPFGSEIMGILKIPVIDVDLPVYHGTNDGILQVGVGHIEGTALPVGGEGTHCVLSGHTGLPSARLLSDLDQMKLGDEFTLNVQKQVYTYKVDQIKVVLPSDTSDLQIVPGKDYCTLLTCTPYGINSHRLLVRGRRVLPSSLPQVRPDAVRILPDRVARALAVPLTLVGWIAALLLFRRGREEDEFEI